MASWADVGLALAGAPIGAAITVFGVRLTNKSNADSQRRSLAAQYDQQRQQLEFELRREHLQKTLITRSDIYQELLARADTSIYLAGWMQHTLQSGEDAPPTNSDFDGLRGAMNSLRYRVDVFCSGEVRHAVRTFANALATTGEASGPEQVQTLEEAAQSMKDCVIEAAVSDRTTGLAPDGLGGA